MEVISNIGFEYLRENSSYLFDLEILNTNQQPHTNSIFSFEFAPPGRKLNKKKKFVTMQPIK